MCCMSSSVTASLHLLQLALKHRQNKNQKIRIVAFVGSPLDVDLKEVSICLRQILYPFLRCTCRCNVCCTGWYVGFPFLVTLLTV